MVVHNLAAAKFSVAFSGLVVILRTTTQGSRPGLHSYAASRLARRHNGGKMSQTAGNLVIHLIFSTKARQPLITPEIRDDLFAYLGGIVREMRGTALIVGGTTDHVHMLIRIRPAQAAAERPGSSRLIRHAGSARKRMRILPGRTATALSASANPTCPP